MHIETLSGYVGDELPPALLSLFPILERHGFALEVSARAGKTINITRSGVRCGYINGRVLGGGGVLGYHFAPHGKPVNSCPPELVERLLPFFCEHYGSLPSDLVVQEGGGTNRGRTFLVIKNAQIAINVLLRDAGIEVNEALQIATVSGHYVEGALVDVVMKVHERSSAARAACLTEYGYNCFTCKENLRIRYTGLPVEVIHVHHEEPLSQSEGQRTVDPIADMKPVCPNCHAVIHARTPPYSVAEVMAMLNRET